jgi:hypothetical protein
MKLICIAFLFILFVACSDEDQIEQVFHYTEDNMRFDYKMAESLNLDQLDTFWNQDSVIYKNECLGDSCTLRASGFVQEISFYSEYENYRYNKYISLFFFDDQRSVIDFLNEYMHINKIYEKGDTAEINENWIVCSYKDDQDENQIDAYIQKWNTLLWMRINEKGIFENLDAEFIETGNKIISLIEKYSSDSLKLAY